MKKIDAIILLGRGGYSQAPSEQMAHWVGAIQADQPDMIVMGAFVDQGEPGLPTALQSCAAAGASHIHVQPVYLPADRNLERWFTKLIMRWHNQWRAQPVDVTVGESLGDRATIINLMCTLADQPGTNSPVNHNPPADWAHDPAGWSEIPDHRHHVLLCRGPRCTALGAGQLADVLRNQIKAQKLLHNDRVLVAQTGCLYPCNLGPVMVVYPEGVWYGTLDNNTVEQIVQEHFVAGQVVADFCYHRANQS
jgi:(2Fe-2S) ferredoxin